MAVDMCIGGSSANTATGPVLNPVDTARDASGSSSGSAALVCILSSELLNFLLSLLPYQSASCVK